MLTYEEFKERAVKEFKDYLAEEHQNCEIELRSVNKMNRPLTGLTVVPRTNNKQKICPCVYIEQMYEHYQSSDSFSATMSFYADHINEAFHHTPAVPEFTLDSLKDKIIYNVVNAESNRHILKSAPHRIIGDLAVIYRVVVHVDSSSFSSAVISDEVAVMLGVNEKTLFELASENTPKMFPSKIQKIDEMMADKMREHGVPEDVIEYHISQMQDIPEEDALYVISNKEPLGGNAILDKNALRKVSDIIGGDFYIIPSSTEEVIAVTTAIAKEKLSSLLGEVNDRELTPDQILSYSIYKFSVSDGTVTVAVRAEAA